jgi:hypothetical protein
MSTIRRRAAMHTFSIIGVVVIVTIVRECPGRHG